MTGRATAHDRRSAVRGGMAIQLLLRITTALFGEVNEGRLGRRSYLVGILGLLLAIAGGVAGGLLAVDAAQAWLYDLIRAEVAVLLYVVSALGGTGLILLPMVCLYVALCLAFALLNLVAKRLRDIGLPGWPSVLFVFAFAAILAVTVSLLAAMITAGAIFIVPMVLPTGTLSPLFRSSQE